MLGTKKISNARPAHVERETDRSLGLEVMPCHHASRDPITGRDCYFRLPNTTDGVAGHSARIDAVVSLLVVNVKKTSAA
ncbi:hypothetical protein ACFWFQ_26540 [Nocardia salmonicida]|uniref:hypothetical protein n=1 Tax=Nocardia salmonicida TaxID=53431 RepID=UPI00365B1274